MDITPYLELKIAPRAVFDALEERKSRPRFMLPNGSGGWQAVSWGAFATQIRQLALYLAGTGFASGERAAIFAPNRVEWISAALAIQAAGGVMVPVYPASTPKQLGYILEHGDVTVLFVDTADLLRRVMLAWESCQLVERIVLLDDALDPAAVLQELATSRAETSSRVTASGAPQPVAQQLPGLPSLGEVQRKLITLGEALALGAARDEQEPGTFEQRMLAVSLDQPGLMLYTSGTTGDPKGVPLTHRNVAVNGLDWLRCNAPVLQEEAVDLLWLPMSHIFGFGEACLGNTLGFTTYLAEPQHALALLQQVRPTVFMSVPAYWEKLATAALAEAEPKERQRKLREATGGRLQFCLSGGAGLKREIKELYHDAGMLIIEGYGLTECSPTLTLNRPDAYRFDSVGKPLPSVELMLAADGEILAKGLNVFSGYHKNPEATRETFTEDGWFKTGDIGRWTEDGFLQIIDRKKEILVTAGGKNVPPANIERCFTNDPLVAHVVVYGDGKKFLTAGIWLNPEAVDAQLGRTAHTDRNEAIAALVAQSVKRANAELAHFEQIKKYRLMDAPLTVEGGLLTSTLKLCRKKIYEAFRDDFESMYR